MVAPSLRYAEGHSCTPANGTIRLASDACHRTGEDHDPEAVDEGPERAAWRSCPPRPRGTLCRVGTRAQLVPPRHERASPGCLTALARLEDHRLPPDLLLPGENRPRVP